MKIHIHYKISESPWGGGNSFLRSFRNYCQTREDVELVSNANAPYDILFFNACNRAPCQMLDMQQLLEWKYVGRSGFIGKFYRASRPKLLVYRSDGFRSIYAEQGESWGDNIQRCCLQIADWVIFQNQFTLKLARTPEVGYLRDNWAVIHNGVDQHIFQWQNGPGWDGRRPLKLLMVNWSNNPNKGYREAAAFSRFSGVEFTFVGNWPSSIPPENVRILPPLPHARLAGEVARHDVFFHPSKFDSCPNVCLEALSCGLPVVYHQTGGIGEIAADCGWLYNDEKPEETYERIRSEYAAKREILRRRRHDFSMERCGGEYLDCFQKLLNERKKQA